MNILWGSYILIGIYSIFSTAIISRPKRKKIFLLFVAIQLIMIFAMRDTDVGVDLLRYNRIYEEISVSNFMDILRNPEYFTSILFYIVIYICTHFGISYHVFLGLFGIIAVVPNIYYINRYSTHPYISVLIYLSLGIYSFQFSGLKQTMAMTLVLFAFDAAITRNIKRFYVFIILAMLCHLTAIICLPIYVIYKLKYKNWMILPIILSLIIAYIFRDNIAQLVTHLFSDGEYLGRYTSSGTVGSTSFFLLLLLVFIIIFANIDIRNNEKLISYYFKLILISVFIQFMSSYAYSFTRLNYYYIQFLPIVISSVIDLPITSNFRNKRFMKILSITSCIIFFILSTFMYNLNVINGLNTVNYQFYSIN